MSPNPNFGAFNRRQRDMYNRALHFLSLRRRGKTVREAEREAGTTARTAWNHIGSSAFRGTGQGLVPKVHDDLERQMLFLFPDGAEFVVLRGSTRASAVGRHWSALRILLEQGKDTELRKFSGRFIVDTQGRRLWFVTDKDTIRHLARTGQVSGFNSIY